MSGENWRCCKVNGFLVLHMLHFFRQDEDQIVLVGEQNGPLFGQDSTLKSHASFIAAQTGCDTGTGSPATHGSSGQIHLVSWFLCT